MGRVQTSFSFRYELLNLELFILVKLSILMVVIPWDIFLKEVLDFILVTANLPYYNQRNIYGLKAQNVSLLMS